MDIEFFHVNLFAEAPFSGVPVPVYVLPGDDASNDRILPSLGTELGIPDSVAAEPAGPDRYRIRFLTTGGEVDHSSRSLLAAAHVLSRGRAPDSAVRMLDRHGKALRVDTDGPRRVWLPYEPAPPMPVEDETIRRAVLTAMGLPMDWLVLQGAQDVIVVVPDAGEVLECRPDLTAVRVLPCRGVGITARSAGAPDHDIMSRYFSPQSQLDEDDVTASLHADLGRYWTDMLGRAQLRACQASRRGGTLILRRAGETLFVGGDALVLIEGTLRLPAR